MSPQSTEHSSEKQRLGGGGIVAICLVVAAGGIVLWSAFGLLAAMFVESPSVHKDAQSEGEVGADRLASHVDQFNGRTMFFTPAAPPPAPVIREPVENSTPRVAAAPSRYGGPSIIGMANDTVWFSDKRQVTVGGEAVGDLRVLSNTGAWHIVVEWQGVEFEVPFLSRDNVILPASPDEERVETRSGEKLVSAAGGGDRSGDQSDRATKPVEETEQDDSGSRPNAQPGDEL